MNAELVKIENDKAIVKVGSLTLSLGHDGLVEILEEPEAVFTKLFQNPSTLGLGVEFKTQKIEASQAFSFDEEFNLLWDSIRAYEDLLLSDDFVFKFPVNKGTFRKEKALPNWLRV